MSLLQKALRYGLTPGNVISWLSLQHMRFWGVVLGTLRLRCGSGTYPRVRKESGEPYTIARRLLAFLSLVHPLPDDMIPPDSILREFIGGSIYGAI